MKEKITVRFSSQEELVAAHTAVLYTKESLEGILKKMIADDYLKQEVTAFYHQLRCLRRVEKAICSAITGGTI